MGYYVDVDGTITFHDIEGFLSDFQSENDKPEWKYFFTKEWGDNLKDLHEKNGEEITFHKYDAKYWYDDKVAMNFLAKYATFDLTFSGEEGEQWRWIKKKTTELTYYDAKIVWKKGTW